MLQVEHNSGGGDTRAVIRSVIWAVGLPALIFIIPLIFYWQVLTTGFLSDDYGFHAIFTLTPRDYLDGLSLMKSGDLRFELIRPTVFLSFQIDYFLWGADPIGFHLTNFIVHSLNALLLFYLARMLGLGHFAAAVAALFFGLYPANPESVTWISGRFDVLALTWLLVCFHLWCRGRLRNDPRLLIASAVPFTFAIFAKENAAAGALMLPFLDWLLILRTRNGESPTVSWNWTWWLVHVGVVLAVIAFRYWILGDIGGLYTASIQTAHHQTGLQAFWETVVLKDFWILITPINRMAWVDWDPVLRTGFLGIGVLTGLALVIGLVRSVFLAKHGDRSFLVRMVAFLAWIIIAILPMAPLQGVEESLDFSRFLYMPVTGLALFIGAFADLSLQAIRPWREISIILLLVLLLFSGVALRLHNETWLEAAKISERIHVTMETYALELPDRFDIFLVNVPGIWKGVHCAPGSYESYLYWEHGKTDVGVYAVTKHADEIDEWWETLRHTWYRPGVGFVWDESSRMMKVLPPVVPRSTGTTESD